MAIEGNSQKERAEKEAAPVKEGRKAKPVADGTIKKRKTGFLESMIKEDGGTIKDFFIETIVVPGLIDTITGIGDIIIESFTDGISALFEDRGFDSSKRKRGKHTDYRKRSERRRGRARDDDDDDDEDENTEHTYDNVHVRTEHEARDVIEELKDIIADPRYGYATVANLFEATKNYVTHTDNNYGWTSLNSATWVRTKNREKPWLLVLPKPKDIRDLK